MRVKAKFDEGLRSDILANEIYHHNPVPDGFRYLCGRLERRRRAKGSPPVLFCPERIRLAWVVCQMLVIDQGTNPRLPSVEDKRSKTEKHLEAVNALLAMVEEDTRWLTEGPEAGLGLGHFFLPDLHQLQQMRDRLQSKLDSVDDLTLPMETQVGLARFVVRFGDIWKLDDQKKPDVTVRSTDKEITWVSPFLRNARLLYNWFAKRELTAEEFCWNAKNAIERSVDSDADPVSELIKSKLFPS